MEGFNITCMRCGGGLAHVKHIDPGGDHPPVLVCGNDGCVNEEALTWEPYMLNAIPKKKHPVDPDKPKLLWED